MLKRTIITLIAVLTAGAVMAQAYRWVDADGVVHYSDRPEEGAVQIQLPADGRRPTSDYSARPAATPAAATAAPAEPDRPFSYDSIEISSPGPEETLWNLARVYRVQQ